MANPSLSVDTLIKGRSQTGAGEMTKNGVSIKTGLMLAILLGTFVWSWNFAMTQGMEAAVPVMLIGLIGGLIVALVGIFVDNLTPACTPIYAALEGLVLGPISAMLELEYPGIALQACLLTFTCFGAVYFGYITGILKYTEKIAMFILCSILGILGVYLVSIVLSLFGISIALTGGGWVGIAFSLFVVGIASWSFIIDFHHIDEAIERRAPKRAEWRATLGLMIGLVWLYIEVLNLLSKIRGQN